MLKWRIVRYSFLVGNLIAIFAFFGVGAEARQKHDLLSQPEPEDRVTITAKESDGYVPGFGTVK